MHILHAWRQNRVFGAKISFAIAPAAEREIDSIESFVGSHPTTFGRLPPCVLHSKIYKHALLGSMHNKFCIASSCKWCISSVNIHW